MTKYFLVIFSSIVFIACKPYSDPSPIEDPRIINPYCNDPSAVNYNWNFPGIPDNSTCFYPSDVFEGSYIFSDSLVDAQLNVIDTSSYAIQILKLDSVHANLCNLCGTKCVSIRAFKYLEFSIDTIVGNGQVFCNSTDTVSGIGIKSSLQDSLAFQINYIIQTDTGKQYHIGTAVKQ